MGVLVDGTLGSPGGRQVGESRSFCCGQIPGGFKPAMALLFAGAAPAEGRQRIYLEMRVFWKVLHAVPAIG